MGKNLDHSMFRFILVPMVLGALTPAVSWAVDREEEECSDGLGEGLMGQNGAPELSAVRAAVETNKDDKKVLTEQIKDLKTVAIPTLEDKLDVKNECGCVRDGCDQDDLESMGIKKSYIDAPEKYDNEAYCLDIVKQQMDMDKKFNASRSKNSRVAALVQNQNRYVKSNCFKAASKCPGVRKVQVAYALLDSLEDALRVNKKDASCLEKFRAAAVAACPQCALVDAMRPKSTGDYILAGLGIMAPVMNTGINAWMYNRGLQAQTGFNNQYSLAYNQYLQQCMTVGIPCGGPMGGMGGMGMGGFGGGMGGGLGYGFPIGGGMYGGMGTGGMPYGGMYGGMGMGMGGSLGGLVGGLSLFGGAMGGGMMPYGGMGIGMGIGGMPFGGGMGMGMMPYGGMAMGGMPYGSGFTPYGGGGMGMGMMPYGGMGMGGMPYGGMYGGMGGSMGGLLGGVSLFGGAMGGGMMPYGGMAMGGGMMPYGGGIGMGIGGMPYGGSFGGVYGGSFGGGAYGGVPYGGMAMGGMPYGGAYGGSIGGLLGGGIGFGGAMGGMPYGGMGIGGMPMGGAYGGAYGMPMGGAYGGMPSGVGLGYGYPIAGPGGYAGGGGYGGYPAGGYGGYPVGGGYGGYPGGAGGYGGYPATGGMGPVWGGSFPGTVGPGGWGSINGGNPGSWAPQSGTPGYYNPTVGMYGNSQYGAMFGASGNQAMIQGMQSQQMSQNVMLAQQQLVEAQARMQSSMSGYQGYMNGGYMGSSPFGTTSGRAF